MIEARVKTSLRLPHLKIQDDLFYIAERIFIPELAKGIHDRRGVDGKALPPNEPGTIRQKGHDRPLIGKERELIRSFIFMGAGKNAVKITINPKRKEIARKLQIEGVKSKRGRKHFNFFGVTRRMEAFAINYMRKRIHEEIARARA